MGFLAAAVLVAAGFLAGLFVVALAAVDLVVGFAAAGCLAFFAALSLTPASFAARDRALLRRAAVALLRTFFFTAVSIAPCAAARVVALGLAAKALLASLMSRFVATLRSSSPSP